MSSQTNQNIIKSYPELTKYEVEYEGNKYDCNKCRGISPCCGTENDEFNLQMACKKCLCQQLYGVNDDSRSEALVDLGCQDCTEGALSQEYCEGSGYLENNLKANITDCSNNLLNIGSGNTLEDITLQSQCNVDGQETAGVIVVSDDDTDDGTDDSTDTTMNYGIIAVGLVILLLLLFFIFS